jgi:hypothetical protein
VTTPTSEELSDFIAAASGGSRITLETGAVLGLVATNDWRAWLPVEAEADVHVTCEAFGGDSPRGALEDLQAKLTALGRTTEAEATAGLLATYAEVLA